MQECIRIKQLSVPPKQLPEVNKQLPEVNKQLFVPPKQLPRHLIERTLKKSAPVRISLRSRGVNSVVC